MERADLSVAAYAVEERDRIPINEAEVMLDLVLGDLMAVEQPNL